MMFCSSNRSRAVLAGIALAWIAMQSAQAQDAASMPAPRGAAAVAQIQARVVGIDAASNSVTLEGPQGRKVNVSVNPQVGDVSKLQLGDIVNIEYRNALLVSATKAKPNAIRERTETSATLPASGGVTAQARRVDVVATVQNIDRKKHTITLRGPQRTVTLDVSPDVSLSGLKKGDMVQAQFEEATAVEVVRNGQPVK